MKKNEVGARLGIAGALASVIVFLAATAHADRVTVKGTVLEGTVKSVTSKSVVLETVYGKGDLVIAIEDVQAISTDAPFHVFHADDVDTLGPVVGLTPETIRIDAGGRPTDVAFSEVYGTKRDPGADGDFFERMAVDLAYWTSSLDLALASTLSTTDTLAFGIGLGAFREKGPSRLRLQSGWRYGTQKQHGESEETTENEIRGLVRQEYDLTEHLFAFGSADAEYDSIEHLSIRSTPKLGLGYEIYESKTLRIAVDAGGAYVFQRFFGGDTESYPAVAFGGESDWKLPWAGAVWRTRLDYVPSLTSWVDEYLLRGETGLLLPISNRLSFKASVVDLYNAAPSDDSDRNSLTSQVGLSLGF